MYLTDGIPLPSVGVTGPLLLPRLDIGLGGEDVQVHLGEGGGGPGREEDFPAPLWSRLQSGIVDPIVGDVTHTTSVHHQSVNQISFSKAK